MHARPSELHVRSARVRARTARRSVLCIRVPHDTTSQLEPPLDVLRIRPCLEYFLPVHRLHYPLSSRASQHLHSLIIHALSGSRTGSRHRRAVNDQQPPCRIRKPNLHSPTLNPGNPHLRLKPNRFFFFFFLLFNLFFSLSTTRSANHTPTHSPST